MINSLWWIWRASSQNFICFIYLLWRHLWNCALYIGIISGKGQKTRANIITLCCLIEKYIKICFMYCSNFGRKIPNSEIFLLTLQKMPGGKRVGCNFSVWFLKLNSRENSGAVKYLHVNNTKIFFINFQLFSRQLSRRIVIQK